MAFNGSFLVAWRDRRRGDLYGAYDIYARRVEADGTVPEPGEFPIATAHQFETDPVATAAPGDRQFAVGYQRFAHPAIRPSTSAVGRTSPNDR